MSVIVLEGWDINACKISLLSTYVLSHVYVRTYVRVYSHIKYSTLAYVLHYTHCMQLLANTTAQGG